MIGRAHASEPGHPYSRHSQYVVQLTYLLDLGGCRACNTYSACRYQQTLPPRPPTTKYVRYCNCRWTIDPDVSFCALSEKDKFLHQASDRLIQQPRRGHISCGQMIIFPRARPSICNLSSRFGTLRLYAGQVRPSRCARLLVSAVLRFPATRLISQGGEPRDERSYSAFLEALGSDLTRILRNYGSE